MLKKKRKGSEIVMKKADPEEFIRQRSPESLAITGIWSMIKGERFLLKLLS